MADALPTVTDETVLQKLRAIAGDHEAEVAKRIGQKQPIEQRWLESLQQYYGLYDPDTRANLGQKTGGKAEGGEVRSKVFMNRTRPKTDAMAARLIDLLFPTDDRNWGIQPTPVPMLSQQAEEAHQAAMKVKEQLDSLKQQQEAAAAQEGGVDLKMAMAMQQLEEQAKELDKVKAGLEAQMSDARKRASLMEDEMADQLNECDYNAVMRDVIDITCKIGTGVAKGPVTGDKIRKGWKKVQLATEGGVQTEEYQLQHSDVTQPSIRYTDPWSFFPDMSVRDIKDGQGNYERHLMNDKMLRAFAKQSGVDKDAVRRLLRQKAKMPAPSYIAELRKLGDTSISITADVYHVWEYTGPLSADDMMTLAEAFKDKDTLMEMQEVDPLDEVQAVIMFCQGEILKFGIYPYDSGECMYSVFNLLKDESTVFGYGVPWMMEDPQRAINAAWRAMLDNAGMSAGPQLVVSKGLIEPADGDWRMYPRKVWWANEALPNNQTAFQVFDIPSQQANLAAIVAMAEKEIDEMTSMPKIAQGEQGTEVTKTAQGMSILMNSAGVVFRRIVKNFDDDMTVPNIRRLYDFNMQHSTKEYIKGDYNIDARGSSVLLVREMQSQNLLALAMQFSAHPVFGPMLKDREMLRMVFKAFMIPADQVMLSDTEIDTITMKAQMMAQAMAQQMMQQQQGQSAPAQDPAIMEREFQLRQMEIDAKVQIAEMQRETALMSLAEKSNMNLDALKTKLQMQREKINSDERKAAVEVAVTRQIGPTGGGNF